MPLSDNKGIWLFFNKKGSLISKIPNGQVIRQGGSFTLILAFEDENYIGQFDSYDHFTETKKLYVAIQKPGEKNIEFLPSKNIQEIMFKKYKANEITYGLVDGKTYKAYKFDFDPTYTDKYGIMNVVSKITDLNGDEEYYQGSVQLYIEPTYNKKTETTTISISEKEHLLNLISDKLDKNDGTASNLKIDSQITEDKHAATKKYVDDVHKSIKREIGIENSLSEVVLQKELDNTINNVKQEIGIESSLSEVVLEKEMNAKFEEEKVNLVKYKDIEQVVFADTTRWEDEEIPVLSIATNAINDINGNKIDETYLKISDYEDAFIVDKEYNRQLVSGTYLFKSGTTTPIPLNNGNHGWVLAEAKGDVLLTIEFLDEYQNDMIVSGNFKTWTQKEYSEIGLETLVGYVATAKKQPYASIRYYFDNTTYSYTHDYLIPLYINASGSLETRHIYAPTKRGKAGQFLVSGSSSSEPEWKDISFISEENVDNKINTLSTSINNDIANINNTISALPTEERINEIITQKLNEIIGGEY